MIDSKAIKQVVSMHVFSLMQVTYITTKNETITISLFLGGGGGGAAASTLWRIVPFKGRAPNVCQRNRKTAVDLGIWREGDD